LLGYKRQGFLANSLIRIDIKELGITKSSLLAQQTDNSASEGAFYYAFHNPNSGTTTTTGGLQHYNEAQFVYDANGLAQQTFHPRNMPTLTLELRDAENGSILVPTEAQISDENVQAHFWLRILVECD